MILKTRFNFDLVYESMSEDNNQGRKQFATAHKTKLVHMIYILFGHLGDRECRMPFKYLSQFHHALVDVRFPTVNYCV